VGLGKKESSSCQESLEQESLMGGRISLLYTTVEVYSKWLEKKDSICDQEGKKKVRMLPG